MFVHFFVHVELNEMQNCKYTTHLHLCVLVCFQPQHNTFFLAVPAQTETSQRLQRSAAFPHKVLNILLLFKPVLSNITGSFHLCSLDSLNVGFEKHTSKKKE